MPKESLPSPERKPEGKKLDSSNQGWLNVKNTLTEGVKSNLLQLKKSIAVPLRQLEKNTAKFAKKYVPDGVKQFAEGLQKNIEIERMSEAEFVKYLRKLNAKNQLGQISTSNFIFKSELLEASQLIDPKEAQKLIFDAKEKYSKCFINLLRMKARGTPREEIYMYLLTQQGGYRRSTAYVMSF